MRTFLRWWETLGRPERIVAMSLATGGIVAIANSTTWAIAVCYMSRQKTLIALHAQGERTGAGAGSASDEVDAAEGVYGHMAFDDAAGASASGLRMQ